MVTSNFSKFNSNIFIDILEKSSIEALPIVQIEHEPSWIDPLIKYIAEKILPDDPVKARRIKRQAP